jgi:hypothetical protein
MSGSNWRLDAVRHQRNEGFSDPSGESPHQHRHQHQQHHQRSQHQHNRYQQHQPRGAAPRPNRGGQQRLNSSQSSSYHSQGSNHDAYNQHGQYGYHNSQQQHRQNYNNHQNRYHPSAKGAGRANYGSAGYHSSTNVNGQRRQGSQPDRQIRHGAKRVVKTNSSGASGWQTAQEMSQYFPNGDPREAWAANRPDIDANRVHGRLDNAQRQYPSPESLERSFCGPKLCKPCPELAQKFHLIHNRLEACLPKTFTSSRSSQGLSSQEESKISIQESKISKCCRTGYLVTGPVEAVLSAGVIMGCSEGLADILEQEPQDIVGSPIFGLCAGRWAPMVEQKNPQRKYFGIPYKVYVIFYSKIVPRTKIVELFCYCKFLRH